MLARHDESAGQWNERITETWPIRDLPNLGLARMRSPSERLINLLTTTGLCSRAELDHCEPFVRRLCHDLPDFDSVWLDALVQQRFLTPWQAEQIQADKGPQLVVERFRLQQPLGQSTFLATEPRQQTSIALKALEVTDAAQRPAMERRLAELISGIDRSRNSVPASLVLPNEVVARRNAEPSDVQKSDAADLFLVAPFVRGWSMEELLIRGGRLPSPVVAEIGRELLTALAWLESARLLHNDLVTRNVRLDPGGHVRLTDPFSRRLLSPQFGLTDQITLRDCDGIAPEQVGTGRESDARSELYSLGCLLWQLLTSRPVVLTADPVSRLMKQKDHDIVDVRGPVPDCPEWMSRIIQSMTRRSPELRPASAAEVLKLWRASSGNSLSQCRSLARQMPDHSVLSRTRPVVRASHPRKPWMWPAAATAVLGLLVMLAARSGVLPKALRLSSLSELTASLTSNKTNSSNTTAAIVTVSSGPIPLPAIDADGVIHLNSGTTYLAEPREFPGALRIVCEDSSMATVLVPENTQWRVKAKSVELRGVRLSQQTGQPAIDGTQPTRRVGHQLLAIQCASLVITDCVIQSPSQADEFVGVAWYRAAGDAGVVVLQNTVFAGGGYGVSFNHPPRRCEFDNVLMANRGSGVLCEFSKGDSEAWEMTCKNVTQRFGFSLLDAIVHPGGLSQVSIALTSIESVYDPQKAILRLQAPESWQPDAMHVLFRSGETGIPAVVPPNIESVVHFDKSLGQLVSLPELQVTENYLLLAELTFEKPAANSNPGSEAPSEWASAALADFEGPKLTAVMPGVDVTRLPNR